MTTQVKKQNTKAADKVKQPTASERAAIELRGLQYHDDAKVTKDTVTGEIKKAVAAVRSGRRAVQRAAVTIVVHAYRTGDYSAATELVDALGSGINGRALVSWFATYGGLRTRDGEAGFTGWRGKDYIASKLDEAKAAPWWTMRQENPWAGFDLDQGIERLLKQYERAVKRVSAGEDASKVSVVVSADNRAKINKLLSSLDS